MLTLAFLATAFAALQMAEAKAFVRRSTGFDECANATHNCHPSARCRLSQDKSPSCKCPDGYNGDGHSQCQDVDECQVDRKCGFGLNDKCQNTAGSFLCRCDDGWLEVAWYCKDIDECKTGMHTCHEDDSCKNSYTTYWCKCDAGYETCQERAKFKSCWPEKHRYGYNHLELRRYLLITAPMTYQNAIETCEKLNGKLAEQRGSNYTQCFAQYTEENMTVWISDVRELSMCSTFRWVKKSQSRNFWLEQNTYFDQIECSEKLPFLCESEEGCHDPESPKNGQAIVEISGNRKIVRYTCNEGYTMIGTSERTCSKISYRPRDKKYKWSGFTPTCHALLCPYLRTPKNGKMSGRAVKFGSVKTFSCNHGYNLYGPINRTCQANGTWSGLEAICFPDPQCPEIRPHEHTNVTMTSRVFKGTATFVCTEGHRLNGEHILTCQANGEWSGSMPLCESVTSK